MVFNRLCAPDSKLGCLQWLETVAMPAMPESVTHDQLLRTMDALMERAEAVEERIAEQLRLMLDQQLSVVFYDLTTVRIHGDAQLSDDVRAFGMNKETGGIARQFVLGVVNPPRIAADAHGACRQCRRDQDLERHAEQGAARFPVERVIWWPTAAC